MPDYERVAISKKFIAYAGKYKIENDTIIHEVEVSFIPNLMNEKSHKNSFRLSGNKLVTISKPESLNKDDISIVLCWEKIIDE